jgi:hypothetical protein
MKITVEFDTWEEMELFRTSGKKTRGKSQMTEVEEAVEVQAAKADPTVTRPPQIEQTAQAIRDAQPLQTAQNTFAAQVAPQPQPQGFPGANGPTPPPPSNPLVAAIVARIDGAINSGQAVEAIVNWFRQQIGPDAANATLDQIKQVFVPRLTEAQLKQIAPQLGIAA